MLATDEGNPLLTSEITESPTPTLNATLLETPLDSAPLTRNWARSRSSRRPRRGRPKKTGKKLKPEPGSGYSRGDLSRRTVGRKRPFDPPPPDWPQTLLRTARNPSRRRSRPTSETLLLTPERSLWAER